jgi:hypothetical protein
VGRMRLCLAMQKISAIHMPRWVPDAVYTAGWGWAGHTLPELIGTLLLMWSPHLTISPHSYLTVSSMKCVGHGVTNHDAVFLKIHTKLQRRSAAKWHRRNEGMWYWR